MPASDVYWPSAVGLREHWTWRPEWGTDRPCLYWYLTFEQHELSRVVRPDLLDSVAGVPWLDPVPTEWMHLTLCDVGFVDELPRSVVNDAVGRVGARVDASPVPRLVLGPVALMAGAVVLQVSPLEPLRELQTAVRKATEEVLGPGREVVHRAEFWPHVSLGYVNGQVSKDEGTSLVPRLGHVHGTLKVECVSLVSVTRRNRHYQWELEAELPLRGGVASTSARGR